MLDLPKLPGGYRWVLTTSQLNDVVVKLQKRSMFGFWYTVAQENTYIRSSVANVYLYRIEEDAQDVLDRHFAKKQKPGGDSILGVHYTNMSDDD